MQMFITSFRGATPEDVLLKVKIFHIGTWVCHPEIKILNLRKKYWEKYLDLVRNNKQVRR